MINDFIEVIVELWNFVFSSQKTGHLTLPQPVSDITAKSKIGEDKNLNQTNFLTGTIVENIGRPAYVQVEEAICYAQSVIDFDTKLGSLFYGDVVSVKSINDKLALVSFSEVECWMRVEDLVDDKSLVIPNLKSAYTYSAKNSETIKLRKFINDSLLGGWLGLSLQPLELIIYLLKVNRIIVNWSFIRPRVPGKIHDLLRGRKGVSVSIEPRTNSLIEYTDESGRGVIGFVHEVSPDLNISFSSVGRIDEGEYRQERFTHDEWKEWRPVFISFV